MESRGSHIKMSGIRHQDPKSRPITENSGDNGLSENKFLKRISVQAYKNLGDLLSITRLFKLLNDCRNRGTCLAGHTA